LAFFGLEIIDLGFSGFILALFGFLLKFSSGNPDYLFRAEI